MTERQEDEPIWCLIELGAIAGVVEEYELWKDNRWYHEVDWATASAVLDQLLHVHAVDGQVDDLCSLVDAAVKQMRQVDAEGVLALVMEPITATHVQLTNGGHRLNAMWRQGVTTVPGLFCRGDIPGSVPAYCVYPPRRPPTVGHPASYGLGGSA